MDEISKKMVCSHCMERSRCKDGTECKEVLELKEKLERRTRNLKGWLQQDEKKDGDNSTACMTPPIKKTIT